MRILVRPARSEDAEAISALAAATFRDAFGSQNTEADMSKYIADAFQPEKQKAEILDTQSVVLVAQGGDGDQLVGYAHLVAGGASSGITGEPPIELKRLYVDRAWHGRGVAQSLMDSTIEAARLRGAQTIWLGVWEHNPRAVAFYAKYGFQRVGEHTFLLGSDQQTDWLLARPV
ncbi:MAG: GNAT family N-acetyltransferase [Polyangiaceae bacterium]|nr:GNAT family N-acetyltransferase [Polyangiaceae bacterium]